ncbi:hypothetical protein CBQ26_02245 [Deinococcus indicus]|uniref:Uncharacterized protein n=1 Tax=Deinococcus indicus TaxID=223556 RepID=A0A246BRI5_9DEIO|nr:hypothetical protein [Deinococcus indicus]OWL98283.1 hypothetical protein CBQ26_02245 [Deinococcus indicus]GHG23669.1 hypothetical protein GCM10017784_14700 [Deinococcus indicus]
MTPDDAPSLNPTLAPHPTPTPEHRPAEQGPAPADLPPAPAVPAPSGDALSAREVEALMGGADASMTEANMALNTAEGLDPDTES